MYSYGFKTGYSGVHGCGGSGQRRDRREVGGVAVFPGRVPHDDVGAADRDRGDGVGRGVHPLRPTTLGHSTSNSPTGRSLCCERASRPPEPGSCARSGFLTWRHRHSAEWIITRIGTTACSRSARRLRDGRTSGAFSLESTNLPPYSATMHRATGRLVFDARDRCAPCPRRWIRAREAVAVIPSGIFSTTTTKQGDCNVQPAPSHQP
jgi:hypothetical protein